MGDERRKGNQKVRGERVIRETAEKKRERAGGGEREKESKGEEK